jgi:hypothetical protein
VRDDTFPAPSGGSKKLIEAVRIRTGIGERKDGTASPALAALYNPPFDLIWIKWYLKLGYQLALLFVGEFLSRCHHVLHWVITRIAECSAYKTKKRLKGALELAGD